MNTAEGNPFHLEELVKWLVESDVIVKDDEVWHVREERIHGVNVPPTLRGVLQARIDALSPPEHLVLQRASVIGRVFWDDAVDSLTNRSGLLDDHRGGPRPGCAAGRSCTSGPSRRSTGPTSSCSSMRCCAM